MIDVVLVAGLNTESGFIGSGFKTIKLVRIVRVVRTFRFFRELYLIALMIADSIKSLCYAFLMLAVIIYVFAIILTQNASTHLKANRDQHTSEPDDLRMVSNQFGTLPRTIYYLVLSMLGGISWVEVSDTLMTIDWFSTTCFFFYIGFVILAVLNIITGVFVDNAMECSKTQRDFLIQKENALRERYLKELEKIFSEIDDDGSGSLTREEMHEHLQSPDAQSHFYILGLKADDVNGLFDIIDDDESGEVNLKEFLDGCLRLKGEARRIDVLAVQHECTKMTYRAEVLGEMFVSVSNKLDKILKSIRATS
jgi:hypothetical protein